MTVTTSDPGYPRRQGHPVTRHLLHLHRPLTTYPPLSEGSMMEIDEIKKIIPHRYPMLLVDRIIECDYETRIVGIKNVTQNEPFFQGHFPDFPVMPGVLVIESLAQVACILALKILKKEGHPTVFFTGIDSAKFRKPVVPGDQLRLELTKIKQRGEIFRFQGYAYVGDKLAAECILQAMLGKNDTSASGGKPKTEKSSVKA